MRSLVVLGLFCLLVPASLAGSGRSVLAPAPVTALALDGGVIAFASGRLHGECDRVRLWNLRTLAVTTFDRVTSCAVGSTGTGIAAVAVAGGRALWLHYTGGNNREWSLFTATRTRPTPRRLVFVSRDVDAEPPVILAPGAGALLAYAVDRAVVALRADGSRRFTWTAPAPVTALAASHATLAVARGDGEVTVLDVAGRVLRTETFVGAAQVVRITSTGLLVQRGRTLELRTSGGETRTWLLPARALLEDATVEAAYYVTRGQLRELRLDAVNSQRLIGLGSHVQIEAVTRVTSAGRRVTATATR